MNGRSEGPATGSPSKEDQMKMWEKVALVVVVASAAVLILSRTADARFFDLLWWIRR